MVECSFCGREESPHIGVHLIKNDGNVAYFCSEKCRKNNLKLKRDKKRLKWTAAYRHRLIKESEEAKKLEERSAAKKAEKKTK